MIKPEKSDFEYRKRVCALISRVPESEPNNKINTKITSHFFFFILQLHNETNYRLVLTRFD